MSCEITEKELLAAAQYYNIPPAEMGLYVKPDSLVEYLESGDAGYNTAIESLRKKDLFTLQRGKLKADTYFRYYIRSHKKPDLLVDYISSDHERTKTTSFLRKNGRTYSMAKPEDGRIIVMELKDQNAIQDIIVDDQGKISSPDETDPLELDYKEFLVLSAVINFDEPDPELLPGETTFNASDISNWLKKGFQIGYVAGLLYFGEKQKVKSALKTREDVTTVLSRLVGKNILRNVGGNAYQIHDDILPVVWTMASPQKTSIISVVNKPFSRTPNIWECVLMKYGKQTVLMEFSDISDLEMTITTIPNKKQLSEYVTTLMKIEISQIATMARAPKQVHDIPQPPPPNQPKSTPPIKFCMNCGARLSKEHTYCLKCGAKTR